MASDANILNVELKESKNAHAEEIALLLEPRILDHIWMVKELSALVFQPD